jgi:hypothetical protein
MTTQFFRMLPRALFHSKEGKAFLDQQLTEGGVYVLYRGDQPYYIGKTKNRLSKRLSHHALRPNTRYYNFWNYFSAFQIHDSTHSEEIEAILISAMPTANSSKPKFYKSRVRLDRHAAKMLNDIQAMMLTRRTDESGEQVPESDDDEDE